MNKNPKVDTWMEKLTRFKPELTKLREILLEFNLDEEFKWWTPVYDYNKKNVIILGKFKTQSVISFVKGTLLKDPYQILKASGPNSQAAKVIRFNNLDEVLKNETYIREYIAEAIEIQKQGLKIEYQDYELPEELVKILKQNSVLNEAWEKLTRGRKKGFVLYFSSAKQSQTRIARIEKCYDLILEGKGLQD